MNKLINKISLLSLSLLMLLALGACSKSDGLEKLLSTVPDDALFVVTVNADEVLSQLDYSQDGDKASFCPEFKTALEKMGVKTSDTKAMGQFLALVEHQMVVFGEDKEVYLSFLIKDEEGFMKWFTENTKEKFTEEDGFQVADSHLAIKNGQAWVSDSKIDTGDLKDFLDEGDDCFAKKYEKIASEMCKKENVVYAFANIDELMSFLRKSGESSVPEMQLVLNTAFKDPAFATGYVTLSDSEVTGTITVLNYQMEPAEFLLPTGKISTAAMNKVNNDDLFVGAIGISPELTAKLTELMNTYAKGLAPDEKAIISTLLNLQGTSAFSVDAKQQVIASLGFKDAQSASAIGQFATQMGMPVSVSTAGNYLLLRMGSAAAKGTGPKEFEGQFIGIKTNYSAPGAKELFGFDASTIGSSTSCLGPNGKGIQLKSVWKHKEPVKAMLSLFNEIISSNAIYNLPGFGSAPNYEVDSVATEEMVVEEVAVDSAATW